MRRLFSTAARPLAGLRVLDLSRLLPGPYATLLLSDLGAQVTKVEDSRNRDPVAFMAPFLKDGSSVMYRALNRGKDIVDVGLDDRDAFDALLADHDVLVEGFRPGVLARLGWAWDDVRARHTHLVTCSITGYGQTGADAQRAGHDVNYCARAGVLAMGKTVQPLPVQVADLMGGSWPAALRILAAVHQYKTTGVRGEHIDVAMADGAHAALILPLARRAVADEPIAHGADGLVGSLPNYDVYACADGHVAVGALEERFAVQAAAALGIAPMPSDFGELRAAIGARLAAEPREHWRAFFAQHDVMCDVVLTPEEAHEHFIGERGMGASLGDDGVTVLRTPV